MKKTITYAKLIKYIESYTNYFATVPKGKKTTITVAAEKVAESLQAALSSYNKKIDLLRSDFASVDKDDNLIINEGLKGDDRFSFTPAKRKAFLEAVDKLEQEEVKIESFIISQIPRGLTPAMVRGLKGIILPDNYTLPEPEYDEDGFVIEGVKSEEKKPEPALKIAEKEPDPDVKVESKAIPLGASTLTDTE